MSKAPMPLGSWVVYSLKSLKPKLEKIPKKEYCPFG